VSRFEARKGLPQRKGDPAIPRFGFRPLYPNPLLASALELWNDIGIHTEIALVGFLGLKRAVDPDTLESGAKVKLISRPTSEQVSDEINRVEA
jgi:hypothetical protein